MNRPHIVKKLVGWVPTFLVLTGPFEYATWVSEAQQATVLSMSKAYQYVEILGGEAVSVG